MPVKSTLTYPTRDDLWKEYESCQKSAQSLEAVLWQTNAGLGLGSIGTIVLIFNHTKDEQLPWQVILALGSFFLAVTIIWLFMARRWWSIQHAFFIRMRHIEEDLSTYQTRYIHYLDNPCELSKSGLSEQRTHELQERATNRKSHQRAGVQSVLLFYPLVIFLVWGFLWWWRYNTP